MTSFLFHLPPSSTTLSLPKETSLSTVRKKKVLRFMPWHGIDRTHVGVNWLLFSFDHICHFVHVAFLLYNEGFGGVGRERITARV